MMSERLAGGDGQLDDARLDEALARQPQANAVLPWHESRLLRWALLAGLILITLAALGVRTLVPPDEGRYAEIGREMFASGDWITTRLNGIKYFEKPPLQAWMNALTFNLFGLGEWQARLWTGVCGIVGVVMTAHAGSVVFSRRVGLYAGLVLASSLFWLAAGQINSLDMSLAAMMSVSLASVLIAQRDGAADAERRNWMLAAWAGMALAMLAKGLVGIVLPGAVLVLYSVAARDLDIWRRLHPGKGLLVLFGLAAPWFILVGVLNPEQPHFFFIHEHFERFLSTGHHREGAWWYFVPLLLAGVMPWLGLLPQGLAGGLHRQPGRFQPRLLLLVWAVFIFVFFSVSSSKLPGYIVPVFPALALLMAVHLERAGQRPQRWSAGLAALAGALLLGAVAVAVARGLGGAQLRQYQPWVIGAGTVLLAGGAFAWHAAGRSRRDLAVLTLAVAGFAATHLLVAGFEVYGKDRAGTGVLPAMRAELTPDTRLYAVGAYEQSLTFYLERPVTLVDYTDEFTFGLAQEPWLSLPRVDDFIAQWRRDADAGVPAMAITGPAQYAALQARGVPMRVVARDSRRLVISNQLLKKRR